MLFDEIALMPGLYYNKKEVIVFEDFGDKYLKTLLIMQLVVMTKGIKTKAKQFIYAKAQQKHMI